MKNYIFLVCTIFTVTSQQLFTSDASIFINQQAAARANVQARNAAYLAENANIIAKNRSAYSKEAWAKVEASDPIHKERFQSAFKKAYAAEKSAAHARKIAEQWDQEAHRTEARSHALARAHLFFH